MTSVAYANKQFATCFHGYHTLATVVYTGIHPLIFMFVFDCQVITRGGMYRKVHGLYRHSVR